MSKLVQWVLTIPSIRFERFSCCARDFSMSLLLSEMHCARTSLNSELFCRIWSCFLTSVASVTFDVSKRDSRLVISLRSVARSALVAMLSEMVVTVFVIMFKDDNSVRINFSNFDRSQLCS